MWTQFSFWRKNNVSGDHPDKRRISTDQLLRDIWDSFDHQNQWPILGLVQLPPHFSEFYNVFCLKINLQHFDDLIQAKFTSHSFSQLMCIFLAYSRLSPLNGDQDQAASKLQLCVTLVYVCVCWGGRGGRCPVTFLFNLPSFINVLLLEIQNKALIKIL